MQKTTKILITGGHVTPALAVIDELQKSYPHAEIVFVGRKYNNQEKTVSFEFQEVTSRSIRFIHLQTGRSSSLFSLNGIRNGIHIILGFFRSWSIISREKPDLVLSFGGYLALPIAYVARLFKIRIFTHEQTVHPGVANRRIGQLAERIFISFPESAKYFPEHKVIISGNPIRKTVFEVRKTIKIPKGIPVLYITGGSLGAHALNVSIEKILSELLKSYVVIHQTGNISEFGDNTRFEAVQSALHEPYKSRYIVRKHVNDDEIGYILSVTDIVIGRSGANTFFELIAREIPAILVPLPAAAFDEQRKQAVILKQAGVAEIFEQDADPTSILRMLSGMLNRTKDYEKTFAELNARYRTDATEVILSTILGENSK